ncbi:MAG TPA: amidohydrolase family protein [Pirellulaceae bacterium]|nr:amidohydrolase family protein [Pirellulaceae bacterium]
MPHDRHHTKAINRRTFVKASLIPAVLPLAASLAGQTGEGAESAPAGPEIIDTNVHLFEWPFRKLKYDRTEALIAKLRKHRITKAWAGSFEAVLQKQLDQINRRLAEECRTRGDGMFIPIGSVNPAWSDWEEDLRRCHEQYKMLGVRLYPAYHGYALDQPEFARLIGEAAKRKLLVQIVMRMEDERVHHQAIAISAVNVAPLVDLLKNVPQAKVQLINSAGPLLGNNVESLVHQTQVTFDIAATEGNGGVGRLIEGKNYSYRGAIPVERLLFGSHAPYFPCESAVMKLFESPLSLDQLEKLMHGSASRLIS